MKGVLILCLVFGVLALLLAFSRWLAHRPWAAAGNLAVAIVLMVLVRSFWPAAENLATYHPMPLAGPIAQIVCERTGPGAYIVTLTRLPEGRMQLFEIAGDEWRLNIRTLAWRGRAVGMGLQSGFRLDRLSARFLTNGDSVALPDATGTALPSSYSLIDQDEPGEDVWAQARTGAYWERYADAQRAYGAWRPLVDKGRFDVWLRKRAAGSGADLEARAANEAAGKAMQARSKLASRQQSAGH